ncbi:MAG: HAD-IA family hydrolase [bacterium]|nr:HAD-IA family hydrolase [bacterium]
MVSIERTAQEGSVAVQSVIFDLSEVLLTGIKDTGIVLGQRHGLDPAKVALDLGGHRNPLMIPAVWEFFHGYNTEDQYIAEVLRQFPMFGTHDELKRHIRENFREVEGTRGVVLRLRELGYTLALLSIHAKEWIEYCDAEFDIHVLFDVVAYSYSDKVSKPKPEAFTKVLERLQAEPRECLFIDDSIVNVDAAQKLGITGVHFTTAVVLESDLGRLLPNFR